MSFPEGVLKGVTVWSKLSVEEYASANSHYYSISHAGRDGAGLRDLEAAGQFAPEAGGGESRKEGLHFHERDAFGVEQEWRKRVRVAFPRFEDEGRGQVQGEGQVRQYISKENRAWESQELALKYS
jgi:hypothetical protein